MDYSWLKELAENANQRQQGRLDKQRHEEEKLRQLCQATRPFVEKLHLVLSTWSEEFNKHVAYDDLKVSVGRLLKGVKQGINAENSSLTYADEITSFTFSRKDWTYGARGLRGEVEFIEVPTPSGTLAARFEEIGATPSAKFECRFDDHTQQIAWHKDGLIVDGPAIMAICQDYFREFIERTS